MANRTEIATATAIATAIVEDSFCRIISIDAFFVGGGGCLQIAVAMFFGRSDW